MFYIFLILFNLLREFHLIQSEDLREFNDFSLQKKKEENNVSFT